MRLVLIAGSHRWVYNPSGCIRIPFHAIRNEGGLAQGLQKLPYYLVLHTKLSSLKSFAAAFLVCDLS
jgi:hypothetical protein